MNIDEFVLKAPPADDSLICCYKRYRPTGTSTTGDKDSIALVLAHAIATHKETWEPFIQSLFELKTETGVRVGEVWSSESPNHGRSAIMNEEALVKRPQGISGYLWGRAISSLLNSGLVCGKEIVGIGHSVGSTIMLLSTITYTFDTLPFSSLILLEPGMLSRELWSKVFKEPTLFNKIMEMTKRGKSRWSSREAARQWFSERTPWKTWDSRALHLMTQYGLRDLPTAAYPDITEGVTLACTRNQEAQAYVYFEDGFDSLDRLNELSHHIPIHVVYGTQATLIGRETQEDIISRKKGRMVASVTRMNCGHMIPQEQPAELAAIIQSLLRSPHGLQSKL